MKELNISCAITNLPIKKGEKVCLILISQKMGCSPCLYYPDNKILNTPIALPITGSYNGYGGLENIEMDDNVKVLEDYFNMSINHLISVLMVPHSERQKYMEGNHYYNFAYSLKFYTLIQLSGMFVKEQVYEALIDENDAEYNHLKELAKSYQKMYTDDKEVEDILDQNRDIFDPDMNVFKGCNPLCGKIYTKAMLHGNKTIMGQLVEFSEFIANLRKCNKVIQPSCMSESSEINDAQMRLFRITEYYIHEHIKNN